MDDGIQDPVHNPVERSQWRGLSANQWVVLVSLGGLLLAIGATLVLVLRSGMARPALPALAATDPEPGAMPSLYTGQAISPSQGVYWPPRPQPLAAPDAPGNRMWWDARFAYRRAVRLDVVARRAPAGTLAEVLWDGERAVRAGQARADGADVRVAFWDGQLWHELSRAIQPRNGAGGWRVSFSLLGGSEQGPQRYHLYYGYPDALPAAPDQPVSGGRALLLALGAQEAVEWGPTVTWTAHSTATQTLVSPDGRLVFEHPAGGLREDRRVRLRIVPVSERAGFGPLPDYEFHADPAPSVAGDVELARWDPPVTVSINLAGLPGDASSLTWAHFRYDVAAGTWNPVPIEFDSERGILRFTTDQP